MVESRFQQMEFGKRKTLVKHRGKAMPKWEKQMEERVRQYKKRKATDALKREVFETDPNARIWSLYGEALVKGQKQHFSFDVIYNRDEWPNAKLYQLKKEIYDRASKGMLPKQWYYQVFLSPEHLLKSKWIEVDAIVQMTSKTHKYYTKFGKIGTISGHYPDGSPRPPYESWHPGGIRERKIAKQEMERAAKEESQRRLLTERARKRMKSLKEPRRAWRPS
jgi:hypothetical protein